MNILKQFRQERQGFTLAEVIVVVGIISVLALVVFYNIGDARAVARDSTRKGDLEQIQLALKLYYEKCSDYRVRENCSSGEYYGTDGDGWFNHDGYSDSAGSIAEGLVAHGLLPREIIDPTGTIQHDNGQSGYLIAATANTYTVWANLERPSEEDTATQDRCKLSTYDNYDTDFPEEDRMNYCVSN